MFVRIISISILFFVLSTVGSKAEGADTLTIYEIRGDMKAFMCPYLSPVYMDMIERACDCSVQKSTDLIIHVYGRQENDIDEKRLLELAERTGYDARMIHVSKVK